MPPSLSPTTTVLISPLPDTILFHNITLRHTRSSGLKTCNLQNLISPVCVVSCLSFEAFKVCGGWQELSSVWNLSQERREQKPVFNFLFSFSLPTSPCCLWLFLHIFSTLQSRHLVSFRFRLNLLQEVTTPSFPSSLLLPSPSQLLHSRFCGNLHFFLHLLVF